MIRLKAAHFRALRSLALEVSRAADLTAAATLIEERTVEMLAVPVALLRRPRPVRATAGARLPPARRPDRTTPTAATPEELPPGVRVFAPDTPPPPGPTPTDIRETVEGITRVPPGDIVRAQGERLAVTLGSFGGHDWWLVLPGAWRSRREHAFVSLLSQLLPPALVAADLRMRLGRAEHVVGTVYDFSRRLGTLESSTALRQFIVDALARSARAQLASLAIYEPEQGTLSIAVTHGYPAAFVEHVRLAPGQGILGRAFDARRPLLVRDVREVPGARRRPRYRTPSFMAVPLLLQDDVLGIAMLADRSDGQPFEEHDLTAARSLAAPAALALANDRLRARTRELAQAATIDPLTGLFNRRHFQTRIEEEIERARRHSLELSLLLIDIDDFKKINDTLGHLAGDALLRQVSEVLRRSVRVFDVCTRYGGEEFAILMPGSNEANATIVAERIRSRVESSSRVEGPLPAHLRITVSLGLAVLGRDSSSHDLIARADRALYRAKAQGKNRVSVEP